MQKEILAMKQNFLNGNTKSISYRSNKLELLRDSIMKYETEIIDALKIDLGKSEFEAYASEVGFVLKSLSIIQKNIKKWSKIKKVKTPIHAPFSKNYIMYEPYGVVLIIGPYNYPFQLLIEPLIGAISAGNVCVLKPSEFTPNTNNVTKKVIQEVFSKEEVLIFEGEKEVTQELLQQDLDYIFFTGSVAVGRIIGEIAGRKLIPCTLELGGKSPTIVHHDADLKLAAKRIAWGKYLNAGQTCIAPDYVYAHESIKDELLLLLKQAIISFYSMKPIESIDFGRIINQNHMSRLEKLMDPKKVYFGGEIHKDEHYIDPTILDDVDWSDEVMKEEVFGPILPVITYQDESVMIQTLQEKENPLALYVFSKDKTFINQVMTNISFGGGCINDTISHITNPYLPFGGVGTSGVGNYHGKDSFLTFSHSKSIMDKPTWYDLSLVYPPYKDKVKIVKKILK